jgi:hypothetical protein
VCVCGVVSKLANFICGKLPIKGELQVMVCVYVLVAVCVCVCVEVEGVLICFYLFYSLFSHGQLQLLWFLHAQCIFAANKSESILDANWSVFELLSDRYFRFAAKPYLVSSFVRLQQIPKLKIFSCATNEIKSVWSNMSVPFVMRADFRAKPCTN